MSLDGLKLCEETETQGRRRHVRRTNNFTTEELRAKRLGALKATELYRKLMTPMSQMRKLDDEWWHEMSNCQVSLQRFELYV